MNGLLQKIMWATLRFFLRFRYRVRVHGLEELRSVKGPVLVLPNHPAYVDPPTVLSHLRFGRSLRPLVFTDTYRSLLFHPFCIASNAFEVPNLKSHSRDAHRQTTEMIDKVVAGVEAGNDFLIYPSGRLKRQGTEVIGGARIAYELLTRCPDLQVILVRTEGLWGSHFGCAQTGGLPDLAGGAKTAFWSLVTSLLFFVPKRDVSITAVAIDRDQLPLDSKESLNRYLEAWYNVHGGEEPKYVPYNPWFGPRDFDFEAVKRENAIDADAIKPATKEAINAMLVEHLGRELDPSELAPETTLDTLGLDSLERMDMALEMEREFGFRSNHVPTNVGELWLLAEGQLSSGDDEELIVPELWSKPPKVNKEVPHALADTLAEAFVRRALERPDSAAVADQLSGVLTYRKLLTGATLLSKRIAKLEGHAIGIMLPASVAADTLFLAVQMAGKLPVMLNWTTGDAGLAHAVEKLEVKNVVTSQRFLDRLGIEVPGADIVALEEMREGISKWEQTTTYLATYIAPKSFLRSLPKVDRDAPAAVLFTSGSETLPKAVPLSHRNLIADIDAGVKLIQFDQSDILFGFLPPFHSFGMTAAFLMPVLTGIRVVHYPDPTDARGLSRIIRGYGATLMFATPTFLQYIFGVSTDEDLKSLKTVMVGAEKCPDSLHDRFEATLPSAVLLEGYGITECSPVVSGSSPTDSRRGTIGKPLQCVEMLVVHSETHQPIDDGETGLLLVRGESIFHGYLKHDGPQPFLEVSGASWYNTGDLVMKDPDGFFHFRGRMKRFLKIGGEMVSLPALEEPLAKAFPADESGPQIAVEGIEMEGGRKIVLFTCQEISLRDANAMIREAGMQGVMRLDEVRLVEQIPVLGTGKTDYRTLRSWVKETPSGAERESA
ncbi:AMP-binding protein [Blastopirellula sp. JC732]|uniref:AMP-binding protein n=1 Tax=Blastopirellula sediminis TaxID=2894196 RepID=A0A9X1SG57_9BACT|nr:AMP-binding protein [Blastopirellula sediminis]MCC9608907.1 AMP-binding protein [Blastopirellula sediminis]MCC9628316.1 AMP-binding protein [Blastopirellula sediminis]